MSRDPAQCPLAIGHFGDREVAQRRVRSRDELEGPGPIVGRPERSHRGIRELGHRPGDLAEQQIEVQRRGHELVQARERLEPPHPIGQPLVDPGAIDGDGRLVSERRQGLDLVRREVVAVMGGERQHADQPVLGAQWNPDERDVWVLTVPGQTGRSGIASKVSDHQGLAGCRHLAVQALSEPQFGDTFGVVRPRRPCFSPQEQAVFLDDPDGRRGVRKHLPRSGGHRVENGLKLDGARYGLGQARQALEALGAVR